MANTSLLWEEHISSCSTSHSLLSLSGMSSLSSFIAASSIIHERVFAVHVQDKVLHCVRTKSLYIKRPRVSAHGSCDISDIDRIQISFARNHFTIHKSLLKAFIYILEQKGVYIFSVISLIQ